MSPDFFERLLEISRQLVETRSLDPLLKYAMSVALDLFDGEYGYLVLVDKNGALDFRVRQDRKGRELDTPEEKISHTIFGKVLEKKEPLLTLDAIDDPRFHESESVFSLQLRSVMCAPLISHGRLLGAIYVENRSREENFDHEDLRSLTFFTTQTAVAIENALLNADLEERIAQRTEDLEKALAQVEQQKAALESSNLRLNREIEFRKQIEAELYIKSITDPLTNVFNRRHFFFRAHEEMLRATRYQSVLSILMIDLDHFKAINDKYGHATGDQVLRAVAEIFESSIRSVDVLGRHGGEEFAILLPDTSEKAAFQLAERLRASFENAFINTDKGVLSLTISVGIASLEFDQKISVDRLVDRADQALYISKTHGRNLVSTWTEVPKKLEDNVSGSTQS